MEASDATVQQQAEELKQSMGVFEGKVDKPKDIKLKMDKILELMKSSTKTVLLTGNGITSSGLPGGTKYPVKSHMAIARLVKKGMISHVITSNIDGLHTMSGIPSE